MTGLVTCILSNCCLSQAACKTCCAFSFFSLSSNKPLNPSFSGLPGMSGLLFPFPLLLPFLLADIRGLSLPCLFALPERRKLSADPGLLPRVLVDAGLVLSEPGPALLLPPAEGCDSCGIDPAFMRKECALPASPTPCPKSDPGCCCPICEDVDPEEEGAW